MIAHLEMHRYVVKDLSYILQNGQLRCHPHPPQVCVLNFICPAIASSSSPLPPSSPPSPSSSSTSISQAGECVQNMSSRATAAFSIVCYHCRSSHIAELDDDDDYNVNITTTTIIIIIINIIIIITTIRLLCESRSVNS